MYKKIKGSEGRDKLNYNKNGGLQYPILSTMNRLSRQKINKETLYFNTLEQMKLTDMHRNRIHILLKHTQHILHNRRENK
jgi:hypothetical protein